MRGITKQRRADMLTQTEQGVASRPVPASITMSVDWKAMFDAEHELTVRLEAEKKELAAALARAESLAFEISTALSAALTK